VTERPAWQLISVLFSTQPLTPAVAMMLTEAAFTLRKDALGSMDVAGDFGSGRVRDLNQNALLGTIGGPVFEARLETDSGDATVRYILTDEAIEHHEAKRTRDRKIRGEYLN
jgi:hypothetical protein